LTKTEIIRMLNFDIESEHGAIIQYLTHAYAMGEGELACEIEALAREEMRHLDWLAEKVIELGGKISFKRGKMRMSGKTVEAWMKNDVLLEEDAMGPYAEQIKVVKDPGLKRLLTRILSDEKAHHAQFVHFVDKARRLGLKDTRGKRADAEARFLNWGIRHEYTVILQYLLHSYLARDEEMRNELQDQAINEMQHMGWLAEELASSDGNPIMEYSELDKSKSMPAMLKADIKIEKEVAAEYDRGARKIVKDKKLKDLIIRIRDHEIYHTELFNELLKKAK
jgi:bacterioferritin